jgi:hypothetical protein
MAHYLGLWTLVELTVLKRFAGILIRNVAVNARADRAASWQKHVDEYCLNAGA